MNNFLDIGWYSGRLSIYLPEFFPTSAARTRKLIQQIRLSNYEQELLDDLHRYLTDRRAELTEEGLRRLATAYEDELAQTKESEAVLERERKTLEQIRAAQTGGNVKTKQGKEFLKFEYQKQKDTVDHVRLNYQRHCEAAADYKRQFLRQQRAMKLYDADLEVLKEVRK